MLCELAALYLRAKWYICPIGIENAGLDKRNYDVTGICSKKPQKIIAVESKASYDDFKGGIKKGQFNPSQYITELWLAYAGNFDPSELPKNVGILKIRNIPICQLHDIQNKPNACGPKCKNKKNIFYMIERQAISWWEPKEQYKIYMTQRNAWLWSIAVSNSTKLINSIEANAFYGEDEFASEL